MHMVIFRNFQRPEMVNSTRSQWVTLAQMFNREVIESEAFSSYIQEGPSVKEQENEPTHKSFNLKFVQSKRNAGTKMEQRLNEWPTNNWPNLSPIPWASTSP